MHLEAMKKVSHLYAFSKFGDFVKPMYSQLWPMKPFLRSLCTDDCGRWGTTIIFHWVFIIKTYKYNWQKVSKPLITSNFVDHLQVT